MRIAVTADLHWGHGPRGDDAVRALARHLEANPPDLLLLGGDNGTADHFASCLGVLRDLPCRKALILGNHDLWVADNDPRGNSLDLYERHLPQLCANHDFHYLETAPLIFPEQQLAVVGTVNWYDYSWSLTRLQAEVEDWQWRLDRMAFTRGRHNDRRFIRWPLDDVGFTDRVVRTFGTHLKQALATVERAVVLTHHPGFYDLSFPRSGPPSVPDGLLWDAFSGNDKIERVLKEHADRIPLVFCGHTHRARTGRLGPIEGHNIGGDYHFKRLIEFDWPTLELVSYEFGESGL